MNPSVEVKIHMDPFTPTPGVVASGALWGRLLGGVEGTMSDAPFTSDELNLLNTLRDAVTANATAKGFRDQVFEGLTPEQIAGPIGEKLSVAIFVSNEHGETSELWEAFRAGTLHKPCDKAAKLEALGLPSLTCAEEEIADLIIRALDTAESLKVDVAKAVAVKMAYNATRPALHGGKKA